jgi:hypothetical protein
MRSVLLAALLLLLAPALARAELCTCTNTTFDWTAVGTTNPASQWTGCTPTADDEFRPGNGCNWTIPAGSTVDLDTGGAATSILRTQGTSAGVINGSLLIDGLGGIAQEGTSSIQVLRTSATVTPTVTVGSQGWTQELGTTLVLQGKFRSYGASTAQLLDEPSSSAYWQVGDLVHCPGSSGTGYDCASDTQVTRLSYSVGTPFTSFPDGTNEWDESDHATGAPNAGRAFLDTNWAAIATSDVIMTYDPYPGDAFTYPSVNQFFNIVAKSTASTINSIDINVRQGVEDAVGGSPWWPLAKRDLRSGVLTAATTTGQRKFVFASATTDNLVTANMDMVGRWLRFEDNSQCTASGKPRACCTGDGAGECPAERGYLIAQAKENAGYAAGAPGNENDDVILIADKNGVAEPHASGERVWIDEGLQRGQPIAIMAPVTISSSNTTDSLVAPYHFKGTVAVQNVVFERPSRVVIGDRTPGATSPTVNKFENVWLRDPMDTNALFEIVNSDSVDVRRVVLTSGDNRHGAGWACSHDVTIEDSSVRHTGDDMWWDFDGFYMSEPTSLYCTVGDGSTDIRLIRSRAEFQNGQDGSGSGWDFGGHHAETGDRIYVEDAYCASCTSRDGAPVLLDTSLPVPAHPTMTITGFDVNGLTVIGSEAQINVEIADSTITNLTSVGSIIRAGVTHQQMFGTGTFDRFVIRDFEMRDTGNPQLLFPGQDAAVTLKNGIIDNGVFFGNNATAILSSNSATSAFRLENLAFIDIQRDGTSNTCSGGCRVLSLTRGTNTVAERIGISYRPSVPRTRRYTIGFSGSAVGQTATGTYQLGGILVANVLNTTAASSSGPAFDLYWNSGNGFSQYTASGPLCAWNNGQDYSNDMRNTGGNCPGSSCDFIQNYFETFQDGSPEYPNPYSGTHLVHPSGRYGKAACGPRQGVNAPGVRDFSWSLSTAGLEPEVLAIPYASGSGGGGEWPRAY